MSKIYFAKVKKEAVIPSKRDEDAGYDLYACTKGNTISIQPGEIVVVPIGIAMSFDSDKAFIVKERGSTGKIGLAVRMGVVDSGFRGELAVGLNNTSQKTIYLTSKTDKVVEEEKAVYYPFTKAIAQGILVTIPKVEVEEISYEELIGFKSERMLTKLGESGK